MSEFYNFVATIKVEQFSSLQLEYNSECITVRHFQAINWIRLSNLKSSIMLQSFFKSAFGLLHLRRQ